MCFLEKRLNEESFYNAGSAHNLLDIPHYSKMFLSVLSIQLETIQIIKWKDFFPA